MKLINMTLVLLMTMLFYLQDICGQTYVDMGENSMKEQPLGTEINDTIRYRKIINECYKLFDEYSFPNSQARPENFDLSSHLDSIEQRRKEISKVFYSLEGMKFLSIIMKEETDDVNLICILKICWESRMSEGKAILKNYLSYKSVIPGSNEQNGSNAVSNHANQYYDTFDK